MRHLHNILGIFLVTVLVVIIIENYDYKNNTTKKIFKKTNTNELNKMVLTNSNE
jgi:hypothetical protein